MTEAPQHPLFIQFRTTTKRPSSGDALAPDCLTIPRHLLRHVERALVDCENWVREYAFPVIGDTAHQMPVDPRYRAAMTLVHRQAQLDEILAEARLALTSHFRQVAPDVNDGNDSPILNCVESIIACFGFEVNLLPSRASGVSQLTRRLPLQSYWGQSEVENATRVLLQWPAARCTRLVSDCQMAAAFCRQCNREEMCSKHTTDVPIRMALLVSRELDVTHDLEHIVSTGEHFKPFGKEIRLHPSFPELVKLGIVTTRLAMLRLTTSGPDPLMWALEQITGENPVPGNEEEDNKAVADRWIEWGRQRGLLPDLSPPPRPRVRSHELDLELW